MATRRNFTPEQKVAIVRAHLIDRTPVSDLCDQHQIQPTLFYNWQRQLFENGALAFQRKPNAANQRRKKDAQQQQIETLQSQIRNKNEVVAELLEEHIRLKKASGEP